METLQCKMRIAVLWVTAAVAMSAHMIMMIAEPAVLSKTAGWAATAGRGDWVMLAFFWLVPLWLAFLALALKDPANRRLNLVAGAIATMISLWHFFICAVPLLPGGPYAKPVVQHVLSVGSPVVATVLITWYAWKWPKRGASAS